MAKGYLQGYDLKEGRSDYAVKAEDRGHDAAAAAQKYAHQPPTTQNMKQKNTSASCPHSSLRWEDGLETCLGELDSTLMMAAFEGFTLQ